MASDPDPDPDGSDGWMDGWIGWMRMDGVDRMDANGWYGLELSQVRYWPSRKVLRQLNAVIDGPRLQQVHRLGSLCTGG